MPHRVLLQAGHVAPREPGFLSGTGTVREQELVHAIQHRLMKLCAEDGRIVVVHQHGDLTDVDVDVFLALHGDGSNDPTVRGPSFGFPDHPVNKAFAELVYQQFKAIPHPSIGQTRWNYTGGLRFYYGWSRINIAGPEVLVEHGFMTNPEEQAWLFNHIGRLALAHYLALCQHFNIRPRHKEDSMATPEEIWEHVIPGGDPMDGWRAQRHLRDQSILLRKLRADVAALSSKVGVDVDEAAIARIVLEGLSPQEIADAIGDDLAQAVADELAARLTT